MNKKSSDHKHPRVLAISPYTEGFGYAVFDAPDQLIDWGISVATFSRLHKSLNRYEVLLDQFKPNMIVLETQESPKLPGSFPPRLVHALIERCTAEPLPLRRFSVAKKKEFFKLFKAATKREMANKVIEFLPTLEPYRPYHRPLWEKEDRKMKIFDAASIGILFFAEFEDDFNQTTPPMKN